MKKITGSYSVREQRGLRMARGHGMNILERRRASMDGTRVYLGSYVADDRYGYRGRITAFHDGCPESNTWLHRQEDKRVRDYVDEAWASVLVHDGGSISIPIALLRKIEPFAFENPWAGDYFEDVP